MKKIFILFILFILLFSLLLFPISCSNENNSNTECFDKKSIDIFVHINVVSSTEEYPDEEMRRLKPPGYSSIHFHEIWILGNKTFRGIEVNNDVLGHELKHFLNSYDDEFIDPDCFK